MDVAVDSKIPTYSGGLGVLAGDMLRSAADLGIPMIAVSLIHRKGYFEQRLDSKGNQMESPADWTPETHLDRLTPDSFCCNRGSRSARGRLAVRFYRHHRTFGSANLSRHRS